MPEDPLLTDWSHAEQQVADIPELAFTEDPTPSPTVEDIERPRPAVGALVYRRVREETPAPRCVVLGNRRRGRGAVRDVPLAPK